MTNQPEAPASASDLETRLRFHGRPLYIEAADALASQAAEIARLERVVVELQAEALERTARIWLDTNQKDNGSAD